MKIFFTFFTLTLVAMLGIAAWDYTGPRDERVPPTMTATQNTLGWLARNASAVAVMDVIATGTNHVDSEFGYIKTRVVNALYGCTNGQELVILKIHTNPYEMRILEEYANFAYDPTNNSRIVGAVVAEHPARELPIWTPQIWKQSAEPETIVSSTNTFVLWGHTRSWWPDGCQDNLPFTHLTNLLHTTQGQRNWTNYYHTLRDAVPTPASPRVWQDSFYDISELLRRATQEQYEYIMNDPLLPVELQERVLDFYTRFRRYGEDE